MFCLKRLSNKINENLHAIEIIISCNVELK